MIMESYTWIKNLIVYISREMFMPMSKGIYRKMNLIKNLFRYLKSTNGFHEELCSTIDILKDKN